MPETQQCSSHSLNVLYIAVFTAALSSFQFGYNMAVLDVKDSFQVLQSYFGLKGGNGSGNDTNIHVPLHSQNSENIKTEIAFVGVQAWKDVCVERMSTSWYLALCMYTVGGVIGSSFTAYLVQWKNSLLATNHMSILAAALMWMSKGTHSLEMIIAARVLQGLHAGMAMGITPLYIGEISPTSIRGGLISVHQLFITIGLLTAQVLGLSDVFGTEDSWNLLLAFPAFISILQLLILPFLPESPRHLLIDKNQRARAIECLTKFRGTDKVDDEILEMIEESKVEEEFGKVSLLDLITQQNFRRKFFPLAVNQIVQQLCGINAILFYVKCIMVTGDARDESQNNEQILVAAFEVFMTLLPVFLIDRVGRKRFLVGGYAVAAIFSCLLTISLSIPDSTWTSYLRIIAVCGFIAGFAIGPGPVPWILTVEFFMQRSRPLASAVAICLNWIFTSVIFWVFPVMQRSMNGYMYFFCLICTLSAIYFYEVLKETKNKTFQEIHQIFEQENVAQINEQKPLNISTSVSNFSIENSTVIINRG
ncbi:solute carrier family 2, facilitated glucose transporter member 5-like isoform X2 [Clavelina lepadiformis]|uniref:solute carrier family 2, facilitated glucose transporter member 5-like isoform X2 n=1 Tax=Clavelina lepadiformis TaxID=159417 RepID=UPI00404278B2